MQADHTGIRKVRIHYSLGDGYYCTVDADFPVDQAFLSQVEERMRAMVAEDMPICKRTIHTGRRGGSLSEARHARQGAPVRVPPCLQGKHLQYERVRGLLLWLYGPLRRVPAVFCPVSLRTTGSSSRCRTRARRAPWPPSGPRASSFTL